MKRPRRTTEVHTLTVRIDKVCSDALRIAASLEDIPQGIVIERMIRSCCLEAYALAQSKAESRSKNQQVKPAMQIPSQPQDLSKVPISPAEEATERLKRVTPEDQIDRKPSRMHVDQAARQIPSPMQSPVTAPIPTGDTARSPAKRDKHKEQKELDALKERMDASDIGWTALADALGIKGNAVSGWFKRSHRIPLGRKVALEAALRQLEEEFRAKG